MFTLKQLREQRQKLIGQLDALVSKAETEDRNYTDEESREFDDLKARIGRLGDQIQLKIDAGEEDEDRSNDNEPERRSRQNEIRTPDREEERTTETDEEYRERIQREHGEAFRSWLANGDSRLTPEQRDILYDGYRADPRDLTPEQRAQTTGTGSSGGFTVPEGFFARITEATKKYNFMMQAGAEVITTDGGNDLPMPTNDDSGNTGEIIGENAAHTDDASGDLVFGSRTMGAHMYSSKVVRVPLQLIQDSAFNIESYLGGKLGERLGRKSNTDFTVGAGTTLPFGIVTDARTGVTAAAQAAITYGELIDLMEALDASYHSNAKWMFSQGTRGALKKLLDDNNRPLFDYTAQGMGDSLLSKPIQLNNDCPAIAADAKSILFGDFSYYKIRMVRNSTQVFRFGEKYMNQAQVGFLAFSRMDGLLLDPSSGVSSAPVLALAQAAA